MGSQCKKALVAESVRESLHSWCKRVKERSKHDHSVTTRSVCSLDTTTTIDEGDEITVVSGTLSRSSSLGSLNQVNIELNEQPKAITETSNLPQLEYSYQADDYLFDSVSIDASQPFANSEEDNADNLPMEHKVKTLSELFRDA